ncbi:MAG: hypothetical protein JKY93_05720 [Gammaproteobacteria bacterium]|nr:hypothetical protein [Gammaproteobacteria bacterium]
MQSGYLTRFFSAKSQVEQGWSTVDPEMDKRLAKRIFSLADCSDDPVAIRVLADTYLLKALEQAGYDQVLAAYEHVVLQDITDRPGECPLFKPIKA